MNGFSIFPGARTVTDSGRMYITAYVHFRQGPSEEPAEAGQLVRQSAISADEITEDDRLNRSENRDGTGKRISVIVSETQRYEGSDAGLEGASLT